MLLNEAALARYPLRFGNLVELFVEKRQRRPKRNMRVRAALGMTNEHFACRTILDAHTDTGGTEVGALNGHKAIGKDKPLARDKRKQRFALRCYAPGRSPKDANELAVVHL
jgi:hypothetical protein